jgi:hypothetical protein
MNTITCVCGRKVEEAPASHPQWGTSYKYVYACECGVAVYGVDAEDAQAELAHDSPQASVGGYVRWSGSADDDAD